MPRNKNSHSTQLARVESCASRWPSAVSCNRAMKLAAAIEQVTMPSTIVGSSSGKPITAVPETFVNKPKLLAASTNNTPVVLIPNDTAAQRARLGPRHGASNTSEKNVERG